MYPALFEKVVAINADLVFKGLDKHNTLFTDKNGQSNIKTFKDNGRDYLKEYLDDDLLNFIQETDSNEEFLICKDEIE